MDNSTILVKIRSFCAYQERCTSEVITKLNKLGASQSDLQNFINQLKATSFLNDERFAIAYTESKFHQKNWGFKKISTQLRQKGISNDIISKCMSILTKQEVSERLKHLYEKKWNSLSNEKDEFKRKQKTLRYLLSKGYTFDELSTYLD